ncbi:SUF system Fe-S cluster assembly protein [Lacibacterium aquatile]|uniref:SUF system Fe-S cluster assembly protein n=1 Tax=Lacibacterium aquatile TaxID=1168082 RepID=A0ABW5DR70_9PROT
MAEFDLHAQDAPEENKGQDTRDLEEKILDALRTVFDPEIPVNIVELGLIYDIKISEGGLIQVEMTLTTPNCPVAADMPEQVADTVRAVEGVSHCSVDLVWTPPWTPDRMSEEAKLQLNMF